MNHIEKCAQCGKEYDPSAERGHPQDAQKCDSCGVEIKSKQRGSEFLVDDANADDGGEHGLEKTLREASHKTDTND